MSHGPIPALSLLVAGTVLGGVCLISQGPLPGDLVLTQALQEALGASPGWAGFVTSTAKAPIVWITLLLAVALGALRGQGWRGAAVPGLAFVGVKTLDALLRALIYAPKPSPDLVPVASASTASGFPSTFGLVYGALFGGVLFVSALSSKGGGRELRALLIFASVGLLVTGAAARIVLGGHWASQMLASWLLAFALVLALHWTLQRTSQRTSQRASRRGLGPTGARRPDAHGPDERASSE